MGDKLIDSIVKATRISPDRVNDIIERAEDAFWADLVNHAPGTRSGDLDPGAAHAFTEACRNAAAAWLIANVRPVPSVGEYQVRVELRRPVAGERGWWVKDDSSPHAALRELLRDCPDDPPGFPVDFESVKTMTSAYPHGDIDEEGYRVVTVIVGDGRGVRVGDVVKVTTDCHFGKAGEIAIVQDVADGDVWLVFAGRSAPDVNERGILVENVAANTTRVDMTPDQAWDRLKDLP